MIFKTVLLLLCLIAANGQSDKEICPKPEDIEPCSCDREGISCLNAKSEEDIRRAFRAPVKQKATRSFWLNGSPVKEILNDTFNGYKVVNFNMEYNSLRNIEIGAFDGSIRTLRTLSLDSNRLRTFPFSDLAKFPYLSFLSMRKNMINEISENAFKGFQSLSLISFSFNSISKIGKRAFAGLDLKLLDLSLNDIGELGEESLASVTAKDVSLQYNGMKHIHKSAFKGSNFTELDLRGNMLTYLDESVFLPLITTSMQNNVPKIVITTKGNKFSCKGCDEYKWLVDRKQMLTRVFPDFRCNDFTRLMNLTYSSIGCY